MRRQLHWQVPAAAAIGASGDANPGTRAPTSGWGPARPESSFVGTTSRHQQVSSNPPRRHWENTGYRPPSSQNSSSGDWQFKVMSYNVLSPTHLAANMDLYSHCHPACLAWDVRKQRLVTEIVAARCDVVCLQEVDEDDYLHYFEPQLAAAGYKGSYVKRRGDNPDGCATFFLASKFSLEHESKLCYFVDERTILNRDNVALVLRLKPKGVAKGTATPPPSVCIANTHLLFNPRRGDIKLAQAAMLLAELDHLASSKLAAVGTDSAAATLAGGFSALRLSAGYCPTILCGDFNMQPFCPIYKLFLCKELAFEGQDAANLSGQEKCYADLVRPLNRNLLPSEAGVTNDCRYLSKGGGSSSLDGYVVVTSGNSKSEGRSTSACPTRGKASPYCDEENAIQGVLTHQFEFLSAYRHHSYRRSNSSRGDSNRSAEIKVKEISSHHQRTASTLDYIFYTVDSKSVEDTPSGSLYISRVKEGTLRLLGRFGLLSEEEVMLAGGLPNAAMPSDHMPLVAHFALRSR